MTLCRKEPDLELEGLLKRHSTTVKFFQGSMMNAVDLARVKVVAIRWSRTEQTKPTSRTVTYTTACLSPDSLSISLSLSLSLFLIYLFDSSFLLFSYTINTFIYTDWLVWLMLELLFFSLLFFLFGYDLPTYIFPDLSSFSCSGDGSEDRMPKNKTKKNKFLWGRDVFFPDRAASTCASYSPIFFFLLVKRDFFLKESLIPGSCQPSIAKMENKILPLLFFFFLDLESNWIWQNPGCHLLVDLNKYLHIYIYIYIFNILFIYIYWHLPLLHIFDFCLSGFWDCGFLYNRLASMRMTIRDEYVYGFWLFFINRLSIFLWLLIIVFVESHQTWNLRVFSSDILRPWNFSRAPLWTLLTCNVSRWVDRELIVISNQPEERRLILLRWNHSQPIKASRLWNNCLKWGPCKFSWSLHTTYIRIRIYMPERAIYFMFLPAADVLLPIVVKTA